jgi:GNAT superfamily N-acetyltransferase
VSTLLSAVACGLLVERLQYVWTPSAGVPDRPGRLRFRAEPDDLAILDALRRIFVDALDAGIRRDVERLGAAEAAVEELAFLTWLPGPREWWRLAYAPSGDLAGLAVPSRNYAGPQVGFVGVVPEQRGNGYGYELLVECTHLLVAAGAERITATTDTTNGPMAAVFATAGYPVTRHRLLLGYP